MAHSDPNLGFAGNIPTKWSGPEKPCSVGGSGPGIHFHTAPPTPGGCSRYGEWLPPNAISVITDIPLRESLSLLEGEALPVTFQLETDALLMERVLCRHSNGESPRLSLGGREVRKCQPHPLLGKLDASIMFQMGFSLPAGTQQINTWTLWHDNDGNFKTEISGAFARPKYTIEDHQI